MAEYEETCDLIARLETERDAALKELALFKIEMACRELIIRRFAHEQEERANLWRKSNE